MKVEYKFVNPALIGTDLEHDTPYLHPSIYSVILTKDQYENDILTVTVMVPADSEKLSDTLGNS